MPFGEDPIGQLRDYVGAVRAAFASFASGVAPAYESPHYRVTRMQPYFNPGPDAAMVAAPPIYLGGVQRRACALAGEVADGFVTHPTNSNPRYLETCLPGLAEGAARAGRDLADAGFELVIGTRSSPGRRSTRWWPSGSASAGSWPSCTRHPAYRPTLELYGWTEVGPRCGS
jgi:alkanesulfonate monooxygenase SsuD/methylene tetrahydromethanopterin reductase-like flavin-dependent oxidoreductase (luciferase family)